MNLWSIILAAGSSSRMDTGNKLLLPVGDRPMLNIVVDTIRHGGFHPLVVTGYESHALEDILDPVTTHVNNPHWEEGIASSIRAGIAALPNTTEGCLIALGDMPLLSPVTLQLLRDTFEKYGIDSIVYPVREGRQGNPVLFGAQYFPELAALKGDEGGKILLQHHGDKAIAVPVKTRDIITDCDTEDDYRQIRSLLGI